MSTKVIERPADFSFSKNEIRYKFLTDNLNPANLFVQVELYARRFKDNSFLNWTCDQLNHPYVDANVFIDVDGSRIVSAGNDSSGTVNLQSGQEVTVTVSAFDAWASGFGTPYAKLVVKEDETELHNEFTTNQATPLTFTFTAQANKTYTVLGYTRLDGSPPKESTIAMPTVNTFSLIKTFNLKPNTDGNTYLMIDAYLDSLLKWVVPNLNYVFSNASEQSCEYYIRYREISATTPDPAWITTELSHKRIVLKGGIEKQKASRNNYFLYQNTNKNFFTWMPSGRFIDKDERAYLSVLIKTPGTYKLKTVVHLIEGGAPIQNIISLPFLSGIFYHINTGFGALNIDTIAAGEPVFYYDVSILNSADEVVYNPHRFYIEYRPKYEYFDLVYHNSVGGFDGVRAKGETSIAIEKETFDKDGGLSNDPFTATVKTGESSQNTVKRDVYKGNIGFVRTRAHQEALQDILISESVYQFIDSRFVPVLNMQKSIELRKTSDTIYSLPIEWQIPFSNQVFTPKGINLGIGTDTETYE